MARMLSERGITVLSGLARGIDTQAHAATLEVGGRTISVLGSGLRKIYPAENLGLAE
jgi:DNA processing protein